MKIWPKAKASEGPDSAPAEPPQVRDEAMPPHERWIGFIDKIDRNVIHGWCMDRQAPSASIAVEAIGSNGSYALAIAAVFRRDVMESGHGSGHHGFELDIGNFDDDETVTIRFHESGREITQAPIALDPVGALLNNTLPDDFVGAARRLRARIDMHHTLLRKAGGGPLREGDGYDERLLATFDPPSDPEGLVTRFTAQEASRIVREDFDDELVGSLQERLGVLLWYCDAYAAARVSSARVPLSAGQIAALNAPARVAGASDAVTVALFNFVLNHKPTHLDLRDGRLLREAVYWWCAQQAVLHRLEDRLVTPEQVALLAAVESGAGTQFPCTTFMVMHALQYPELADLDLGLPRDRLALLSYLVLASFVDPGLLRFLPREPLLKLSRGTSGTLAAILGRLVATDDEVGADVGTDILRKGEDLLAAAGQSLGHRRPAADGVEPPADARLGVRLVGPMKKLSGLGRAMRLSMETLALCEEQAPICSNFDMENPGAENRSDRLRRHDGPHGEQREITLLHLNAEALPLALAYGPRHLLNDTYRIGYFFWELSEIPECHRLAIDLVDEIWVASEFNRELYARQTSKPVVRVGMAAPSLPYGPPAARAEWGFAPDAFTFVAVFDSLSFIARKNPLGVIEAFGRAFPRGDEPVALVLKTQNRSIVQDAWQLRCWYAVDRAIAADPRIVLVDETLAFPDLLALTRTCNAFVSLHRAEGWGFGIVEAMQIGLPVICTGWSGNADFCTEETAFLVSHRLIPVAPDEYIYTPSGSLWADPSIDSAAAQMRTVASDKAAVARKTEAARAFVAKNLGLEATAQRYGERLAAIRNGLRRAA